MSEAIDLQEVMLEELREFGAALAACILVTPVVDHPRCASPSEIIAQGRAAASPAAHGAAARENTGQGNVRFELDWHAGLLLAARNAVAEARAIKGAFPQGLADTAGVAALTQVPLTVVGLIDWRQRVQSANVGGPGAAGCDIAANISDDILKVLGSCYFSTYRASR